MFDSIKCLDHGYVRLVEASGHGDAGFPNREITMDDLGKNLRDVVESEIDYECGIIEAARQSTQASFRGWETDKKLHATLFSGKPQHATPFEFSDAIFEVQAPIFVFREWHRHRTQCLSPHSWIHFERPVAMRDGRHKVHKETIAELYRKWQPTIRKTRPERQTNSMYPRSQIQQMELRCLNEDTNEFGTTQILDCIQNDPKEMIRVTTTSGKSLTATREHKVLTSEGWATLGSAVDNAMLLTLEGSTRAKSFSWEPPIVDIDKEEWLRVAGWENYYYVSNYGRVKRVGSEPKKLTIGAQGYPVTSLNKPGMQILVTFHSLVLCAFHGKPKLGQEARHLNHNRMDNRSSNLAWGTSLGNSYDMVLADRQQRLVPQYEEIVDVTNVGKLPTYDLTVMGPYHNFVADGFVVHNSYNEMSARYAPLPNNNYIPDIERCLIVSGTNKQAGAIKDSEAITHESAIEWLSELSKLYNHCETVYQSGLRRGIPKEVARIGIPVGRYSRMRAKANLRNWLAFMTLRADPAAQWEIQQYASAVGTLLAHAFPRTWQLYVNRV